MTEYYAEILWNRGQDEIYTDNKYSRAHQWKFNDDITVAATASPHIVPAPYSVAENVDPEQAFVASLSSCHMLFFLDLCAKKSIIIDHYQDNAVGIMDKNQEGRIAITKVILRPKVTFSGDNIPTLEEQEILHDKAHHFCFIANSVKSEVVTEIIS